MTEPMSPDDAWVPVLTAAQERRKRAFDLVGALLATMVAMPVVLAAALAIRLTSDGPALYRQARIGRRGRPFYMYKLRTMTHRARGSHVTVAGDRRITRLGALLRRSKLDELPQLWNVIKGDMSLVGPRPDVPGYADRLEGDARRILDLRPGITGPATLFYHDEEVILAAVAEPLAHNDDVIYPRKIDLNLEYIERWSLARDIGFVCLTVVPGLNRWLKLIPEPGSSDG